MVNIVIMNSTFLNQDEFAKQWTAWIDVVVSKCLQLFFYTKFFPIFSLLFGLGISMQALKLIEKGKHTLAFFTRRMSILFLFGVFHIEFIWSGDVLHLYAVLGLMTSFMLKRSDKLILVLAIVFLCFPFYDQCFNLLFDSINFKPESYLSGYSGDMVKTIITEGSYTEGMKLRQLEYASNLPMLLGFLAPVAIAMFLLGLYLGKKKVYETFPNILKRIQKPMLIAMVLTNIYRIIFLFVLIKSSAFGNEHIRPILIKLMVLCDVVMGLFYLWLIGWLWYYTKWQTVLAPLKYAGRMALTNYIMQSAIGLILFSSLGFKLYETLSPSESFFMALIVFAFQVLLSRLWLSYFRYGPIEWIWRCLTYKTIVPIKRKSLPGT